MLDIKYDLVDLDFQPLDGLFNKKSIVSFIENNFIFFAYPRGDYYPEHPEISAYFICHDENMKNIWLNMIKKREDGRPPWSSVFITVSENSVGIHIGVQSEDIAPTYRFIKWLLDYYQCKVIDSDYGRDFTEIVQKEGVNGLFEVTE